MLSQLIKWDIAVLERIRSFVQEYPFLSGWIRFFSDLEPLVFGVFLIALWIWGVRRREIGPRQVALDIFWHVAAAFVIYVFLNQFLPMRPRPETVTAYAPLIDHLPDNSFPSGHAVFWGASWWALVEFLRRPLIAWGFFVLGGLTCVARIAAGVHYPGDIIVGFFLGWGLIGLFALLPHGVWYRKWGHDIWLTLARWIRL